MKRWAKRYRKTIINAILNDFTVALVCSALPAIYRFIDIKGGEYPGQATAEINQRLAELGPGIVIEAVICFLIIMIVLFVPILIYRFWLEHRIKLIQTLKEYWKGSEESEKD